MDPSGPAGSAPALGEGRSTTPRCPRDGAPLGQLRVGDVVLDFCPVCGGVFFDAGELEALEGRSPRPHMSSKRPTAATPLCVRCGIQMKPLTYRGALSDSPEHPYGVEIDCCPGCNSYWLDGDEYVALRALLHKEERGHLRIDDVTVGQYLLMLLTGIPLEYNVRPRGRPWVTISLVAASVAFYLLAILALLTGLDATVATHSLGLVPARLGPTTLWMLVTYQLVHAGLFHLAGNMYFLAVFGDNLEDRWGRLVYLTAFLTAGIVGGLTHAALAPHSTVPLVGASGAISGLLGAYLVTFPRARVGCLFFFVPLRVSVLVYLLVWFGLQLAGVLLEVALRTSFPVSVSCHAGGFVTGMLIGLALRRVGASARTGG